MVEIKLINLVLLFMAVPVIAQLDYVLFRGKMKAVIDDRGTVHLLGNHTFLIATFMEIYCFMLGYLIAIL